MCLGAVRNQIPEHLMNYYFAYGLTLVTDIVFPELHIIAPTENPDIRVVIGATPSAYTDIKKESESTISFDSDNYFLNIINVGSYYVTSGKHVIIEPAANADMKEVRLFFLSNAMAAILYQRQMIPMHASAIYDNDGIVLFLGDSGAGKSTTVASLQAKGYRIFSDDVCVPVPTPDGISAYAAYPMMKLWKDSFDLANIGDYEEELRIRPTMDKYGKLFNESFDTRPMRIKRIFVLEKEDTGHLETRQVMGIQAFKYLQNYAYRLQYIEGMGVLKDYFQVISLLSNQIPTTVITRPNEVDTLDTILAYIENLLEEKH